MLSAQTIRTGARPFVGTKVSSVSNGTRVTAQFKSWLPGSECPPHLNGRVGTYGFDPLNLATEPANLARYTESEVIHGRWAMLGVAGALGAEVLGQGDWYSAPLPVVQGGHATYFGAEVPFSLGTLLAVEFVAMAGVELFRGAADAEKRIYPGGAFDPMGLSKGNLEELKLKEIKNGRLAMVAFLGFVGQYQANGKSPLEALSAHISSPFAENFAMSKALPW